MSSITWEKLLDKFPQFIQNSMNELSLLNLNVSNLTIDHLGLRFSNPSDVDKLKRELLDLKHKIISSEIVNGRQIFIIKLNSPLEYQNYKIPCIELPYPAKEHNYPDDGWEHLEFVIPSNANSVEELESDFFSFFQNITRNTFSQKYKLDMPIVENSLQPANPTLVIKIKPMLTIKFHPRSIETIVN